MKDRGSTQLKLNLTTFGLWPAVSSLVLSFAHLFIGSLKFILLWCFYLSFFIRCLPLEYLSYDQSDETDKEESDKLGCESGSAGTFVTVLGGLLHGVVLPSGVNIYDDISCDGDGGSLFPLVNIGEAGTGGYECNECTREGVWYICIEDM